METTTPIFTKVFVVGLIQLLLTVLAEIFVPGQAFNWYIFTFSLFITIGTYFARNLRGVAAAIITTIVAAAGNWINIHISPDGITKEEVFRSLILLSQNIIGLFFASPPKSVGYEYSAIIQKAKKEGETAVPTTVPPKPDSV